MDFHPPVSDTQTNVARSRKRCRRWFDSHCPIIELPRAHALALHGPARAGTVSVAECSSGGGWSERAVRVDGLQRHLESLPVGQNVYLSQARFRGWRRTQLLLTVNALWVDLDGVTRELAPHQALAALLRRCDALELPAPSYALHTGRGLAGVWLVEVLPREALPRWRAVQEALWEAMRPLGADPRARDVARVLRLAGSLNTSPVPARLVRCLYPEVGSPRLHRFEALAEALLPRSRPERRSETRGRSVPGAVRLIRRHGAEAQLWADRLFDLDRLLEMRWFGALPPRTRDVWVVLASVALSWMIPGSAVRREVQTLATRATGGQWSVRETRSRMAAVLYRAESAARGETVTWRGVEVDPRYRFRTRTILEWLEVSPEEQTELRTVIGSAERERRYRAHQARRAALGGQARAERHRDVVRGRDDEILRLRGQGLSPGAIGRAVGLSRGGVLRVLRRRVGG